MDVFRRKNVNEDQVIKSGLSSRPFRGVFVPGRLLVQALDGLDVALLVLVIERPPV